MLITKQTLLPNNTLEVRALVTFILAYKQNLISFHSLKDLIKLIGQNDFNRKQYGCKATKQTYYNINVVDHFFSLIDETTSVTITEIIPLMNIYFKGKVYNYVIDFIYFNILKDTELRNLKKHDEFKRPNKF